MTKKEIVCPKCKSKNIVCYGCIIGYGFIDPNTMEVSELGDDFEVYDTDTLEYTCEDCEFEW